MDGLPNDAEEYPSNICITNTNAETLNVHRKKCRAASRLKKATCFYLCALIRIHESEAPALILF